MTQAGPTVLLEGATLIDGTGAPPLAGAAVLVRQGRIVAAGPAGAVRAHPEAATAERLGVSGCWIVPGLIDAHIHSALTGPESMPLFLACGVTTVRDVGGPLDLVTRLSDETAGGAIAAPRFIFSGPLIDGEPPSFPNALLPIIQATPDAEAAAALAEECLAHGAGSIKLYFRLPPDSVREAVARVAGRVPVTGHLGRTRASEAVAAGINGFEHAVVTLYNDVAPEARRFDAVASSMADPNFWNGLVEGWGESDLDAPDAQRLLEEMRRADVTLDATLDLVSLAGRRDTEDPNLRYVRPELRQVWKLRRQAAGERPVLEPAVAERGHGNCAEFVRRYHALGGRVIAGTDVGAVPYLVPGFSLHGEMRMLRAAGLSAHDVLRAATLEAARALRIDSDTGSIEAGKCADLVVLEADPLADIGNADRVRSVMRAGLLHRPEELLAPADLTSAVEGRRS